jgi:hypothetical protein
MRRRAMFKPNWEALMSVWGQHDGDSIWRGRRYGSADCRISIQRGIAPECSAGHDALITADRHALKVSGCFRDVTQFDKTFTSSRMDCFADLAGMLFGMN